MADRKALPDPGETPEDVAALYSWANLHGAKYRDFSASRAQTREQARQRVQEAIEAERRRAREEAEALLAGEAQRAAEAAIMAEAARKQEQAQRAEASQPTANGPRSNPPGRRIRLCFPHCRARRPTRHSRASRFTPCRPPRVHMLSRITGMRRYRHAKSSCAGARIIICRFGIRGPRQNRESRPARPAWLSERADAPAPPVPPPPRIRCRVHAIV